MVGQSRWCRPVERNDRRPFSCSGSLSDTGLLRPATQSTNSSSWVASGSAASDAFGLSSSARDRLRRNSPPSRPRREGCSATFGRRVDVSSVGATSPVALVGWRHRRARPPCPGARPGRSCRWLRSALSAPSTCPAILRRPPRRAVSNAFQVPARLRSGNARCRGLGVDPVGSSGPLDPSDVVAPGSEVDGGTVHVEVTGQADGVGVHRSVPGSLAAVASNNPAVGTSSAAGRALSVPRPATAGSLVGEVASAGAARASACRPPARAGQQRLPPQSGWSPWSGPPVLVVALVAVRRCLRGVGCRGRGLRVGRHLASRRFRRSPRCGAASDRSPGWPVSLRAGGGGAGFCLRSRCCRRACAAGCPSWRGRWTGVAVRWWPSRWWPSRGWLPNRRRTGRQPRQMRSRPGWSSTYGPVAA